MGRKTGTPHLLLMSESLKKSFYSNTRELTKKMQVLVKRQWNNRNLCKRPN